MSCRQLPVTDDEIDAVVCAIEDHDRTRKRWNPFAHFGRNHQRNQALAAIRAFLAARERRRARLDQFTGGRS